VNTEIVLEVHPLYKVTINREAFDRDLWPGDGVGLTLKERIKADASDKMGWRRYHEVLKREGILTAAEIPHKPETPEPPGPPNPDPENAEGRLTRIKNAILRKG